MYRNTNTYTSVYIHLCMSVTMFVYFLSPLFPCSPLTFHPFYSSYFFFMEVVIYCTCSLAYIPLRPFPPPDGSLGTSLPLLGIPCAAVHPFPPPLYFFPVPIFFFLLYICNHFPLRCYLGIGHFPSLKRSSATSISPCAPPCYTPFQKIIKEREKKSTVNGHLIHAVDVVPCRHFPRHEEGGEKEARRAETEEKKEERRKRLMIGEARFVEKWEEGMIKRRRRVKERKWRGMKKKKKNTRFALSIADW